MQPRFFILLALPCGTGQGQAVGEKIGGGKIHVVTDISRLQEVQAGEILVANSTDPDWEPVMRRVAAIVTDQGGRSAHAAIVSREFGIPCIVGTGNATQILQTGQEATVCCAEGSEGHVYQGLVPYRVETLSEVSTPKMRTKIMLIVGDPERAFDFAGIPNEGVGLARIEFIITNHINFRIAINTDCLAARYMPEGNVSAGSPKLCSVIGSRGSTALVWSK